jgi:transcriptional regulator with XRE-family HTH domain
MAVAATYPIVLAFSGPAVARLRERCDLSRVELAVLAGCSAEMVRSLEYGRALPSVGLLGRLAAALGVGVGDLFDQAGAA